MSVIRGVRPLAQALLLAVVPAASSTAAEVAPAPASLPEPHPHESAAPDNAMQAAAEDERAGRSRFAEEHPDDPAACVGLGDAWMQRFRERLDPAFPDRAEAAYQRALKLDGRYAAALVGMAWVANTRHDFDAGSRWARQALVLEPEMPEAHALLGDAAVELGDYDAAYEHYQAALDGRPDLSSYARSAHLLWLTGDVRRAEALMYRAINAGGPHAENTAWCRAELGLIMLNEGALVPAERQMEQALTQAPENPHVLAAMGRVKTARGDYPAAIKHYEQALAIAPTDATLAALTDLYALSGDQERSDRMVQRVLDFHHAHDHARPHSHRDTSQGSHAHGNAELARFLADHDRDLASALREAEDAWGTFKNVGVTDTLAWCYYKNGRHQEARQTILKAMRWRTPDASILFHAGMIYALLGDRPAAQKYLYQALNLNPQFHPIQAKVAAEKLRELGASSVAK
jgi:tetratricopeptide (TPR) repeat protein